MIDVFVLTYNNLEEYLKSDTYKILSETCKITIVDNGNQEPKNVGIKLTKNIGCAGGWNFICKLAFEQLNYKKIIISQDDVDIDLLDITNAWYETSGKMITGIFSPFFEFSTFVITKEVWEIIGEFDENFLNVYCEDADYKQRCYLSGVTINSLYVSPINKNKSISVKKDPSIDNIELNKKYLTMKWGKSIHPSYIAREDFQPPFEYTNPFNEKEINIKYIPMLRVKNVLPSDLEIKNYVKCNRRAS